MGRLKEVSLCFALIPTRRSSLSSFAVGPWKRKLLQVGWRHTFPPTDAGVQGRDLQSSHAELATHQSCLLFQCQRFDRGHRTQALSKARRTYSSRHQDETDGVWTGFEIRSTPPCSLKVSSRECRRRSLWLSTSWGRQYLSGHICSRPQERDAVETLAVCSFRKARERELRSTDSCCLPRTEAIVGFRHFGIPDP